jgi:hypothetical protein
MADAYKDEQFSTIIKSFETRGGFDTVRFRRSLELAADLYLEGKKQSIIRPSERVKQLERLGERAAALAKGLREAREDPYTERFLDESGLAVHRGMLFAPNQGAEVVAYVGVISRTLTCLDELEGLLERAKARAQPTAPAGNRPDSILYGLVLSLREIYKAAADSPKTPTGWSAESGGDEFLRFLQAALSPLGVRKSVTALRDLYKSATGA